MIRQEKGQWVLRTKDGSRVLGTHGDRDGALDQERAIQIRQRTKVARAGLMAELAEPALAAARRSSKGSNRVVAEVLQEAIETAVKKYGRPKQKDKKKNALKPMTAPRAPRMPKQAGIADMPVPESLLYEAASGDPQSAAELKRLEEAHARKVYGMGGLGPMRSVMGRSLLGRTRTAGATTETERKLLEARPELSHLSAGAQPEETYPISRALTTPGLAAIPAAGAGGLLARLIAQAAGASGATRELATAAGVGLGGVAGATAAYGLRQRHAKQMGRWMHDQDAAERRAVRRAMQEQVGAPESPPPEEMKLSSVDLQQIIPFFLGSVPMLKEAQGLLGAGVRAAERAALRATGRAALQGVERGVGRGIEAGVERGAAEAGEGAFSQALSRAARGEGRVALPRAEQGQQFMEIARRLPEGDPRRLILEAEATKMMRGASALPPRPGAGPTGLRVETTADLAAAPRVPEGVIAAPGQELALSRALAGETEATTALRSAGGLYGSRVSAVPKATGELAGLEEELAQIGLPEVATRGPLPRGQLIPAWEAVEAAPLRQDVGRMQTLVPVHRPTGVSTPPAVPVAPTPTPMPVAPQLASPHTLIGPGIPPPFTPVGPGQLALEELGLMPGIQSMPTGVLPGVRVPNAAGRLQLAAPPGSQMAIKTEAGIPAPSLANLSAEPIFPFAGAGPVPQMPTPAGFPEYFSQFRATPPAL